MKDQVPNGSLRNSRSDIAGLSKMKKAFGIRTPFFYFYSMNEKQLIDQTMSFVRGKMAGKDGGHDWHHVLRVLRNTETIHASEQQGNLLVIRLSALLHDIGDSKFHEGQDNLSSQLSRIFLSGQNVNEPIIQQVCQIIDHISFRDRFKTGRPESIEFKIVQDADRLDAIGAIGIARAFSYGGLKKRSLYDPEISPREYDSKEVYTSSDAPTIQHFYEKLFLLKNLMNTTTGRRMAEERHLYMENYVEQFLAEWNGEK